MLQASSNADSVSSRARAIGRAEALPPHMPRQAPGHSNLETEKQNLYGHLILLCRKHHQIANTKKRRIAVELLHQMKNEHERWVEEQLGFDERKRRDDGRQTYPDRT